MIDLIMNRNVDKITWDTEWEENLNEQSELTKKLR